MADIVERLEQSDMDNPPCTFDVADAIDTITAMRLSDKGRRAEVAMLKDEAIALHVELDALKADIANALTDLTDYSIENDALRARVAELGSADTCGRVCEGTAYRLEARSLRARVAELEQAISESLPGTYYMDPPDGGNVELEEQLRRMTKDAARYRWLLHDGPDIFAAAYYNTSTPAAVDAAIDAAREVGQAVRKE